MMAFFNDHNAGLSIMAGNRLLSAVKSWNILGGVGDSHLKMMGVIVITYLNDQMNYFSAFYELSYFKNMTEYVVGYIRIGLL